MSYDLIPAFCLLFSPLFVYLAGRITLSIVFAQAKAAGANTQASAASGKSK